ncbi:MAG: hypothetical protein Q9191_000231 [Dirinaria sp. TL-2023a]
MANPPHDAEGKSSPKSKDPFANEAKGSETQVKDEIDEQLEKRQDKSSKIGVSFYSERDCNGFIATVDDLTQSPGETWLPTEDGTAYSFELLYRGLQGQEQLDISTKDSSNGDRSEILGIARVVSYEDLEKTRAERAAKEAAKEVKKAAKEIKKVANATPEAEEITAGKKNDDRKRKSPTSGTNGLERKVKLTRISAMQATENESEASAQVA